ncbi:hypothetical protein DFH28DRAFT_952724 [Melampsora americana]|nr:hypothetical protein DFH28DRAFT_952724 [Melampsora americana]
MKFLLLALISSAAPFIQATSFSTTSNGINSNLNALQSSVAQIRAVAQTNGHVQITKKCDQAQSHLKLAQSSLGQLSVGFASAPWNARGSSQATQIRTRLSLCGNLLNSIYAQPEMKSFPDYKSPVSQSQFAYRTVQKGVQDIWEWPTPNSGESDDDDSSSDSYSTSDGYGYKPSPPAYIKACREPSCPIISENGGYECLDLQVEVASCGGCVSRNEGENCLLIDGADGVGCLEGKCHVLSVKTGYTLGGNGRPISINL